MAQGRKSKLCIFGAGGPIGAAAANALREDYVLRLTDLRSVERILEENRPQAPNAPLPCVPEPPHTWEVVNVGDYDQVLEAARGMDALVNLSVVRHDVPGAFRVNLVGAYHVMKAAVACGVRRVIHTGPRRPSSGFEADYWGDFQVPDDVPFRSGSHLYGLTKHMASETVRAFSEEYELETVCLLFGLLLPGDGRGFADGEGVPPFTVSWEDAGWAIRFALRTENFPRKYEVFNICARMPGAKFVPDKAERLLNWRPEHGFERLWRRVQR